MLEGFRPCPFCGTNDIHIFGGRHEKEIFESGVKENGETCICVKCDCGAELWQYRETDYYVAYGHLMEKWNRRKEGKNEEK